MQGTAARASLAEGGGYLTGPELGPEHCWGWGAVESSCSPGTSQELGTQRPARTPDRSHISWEEELRGLGCIEQILSLVVHRSAGGSLGTPSKQKGMDGRSAGEVTVAVEGWQGPWPRRVNRTAVTLQTWVMWEKRIWCQSHNQPHRGHIQRQV